MNYTNDHSEITKAAYFLRDAVVVSRSASLISHTDYLISSQTTNSSSGRFSKWCRKALKSQLVTTVLSLCIVSLVFISFIEPPSWCRDFVTDDSSQPLGCKATLAMQGVPAFYSDDTEDEIQFYYPSIRIEYLSISQAYVLECMVTIFLLLHTFLCFGKDSFSLSHFFMLDFDASQVDSLTAKKVKNIRAFRIIRMITTILLVKGLITFPLDDSRPYAIFYRIFLFISYSEGVQRELLIAIKIIPSLFSAAVVLFMVIGTYGLIGVAAFYDTKEGTLHFSNWVEGIWSLWTSMTTVIYPDVMMAGYNENRFVALFFVTFMIFTFFFILNVMLAIVVNGYNTETEEEEKENDLARTNYMQLAFDILTDASGDDSVTQEQLMAIFLVLNEECDEIPRIRSKEADLLFAMLDQDGTEKLEVNEFMNITSVMLLEFEEVKELWIEKAYPQFVESAFYKKLSSIIISANFDFSIDAIVLLNAAVVLIQSYPVLSGQSSSQENPKFKDGLLDTGWELAELVFTVIYAIEMTLKLLLLGWKKYTSSVRNIFDGFITVMAVFATILVYYPDSYYNSQLIRFVVMSRVVRIFRLFMLVGPFALVGKTFLGVLPAAARVFSLLFCVVYIFSAIGMHFFGGLVTRDPNNSVSYLLEGTSFADNFYWANNFNDLLSGINVCFNLLVINNWNEMESGIIAVSQSKWSRYFFFFFFVCGVIIVNNLVVAVVIDYFFSELEAEREEVKEDKEVIGGLKKLTGNGKVIIFDGSKSLTKKRGQYIAKVRRNVTGQQQKKIMSQLIP